MPDAVLTVSDRLREHAVAVGVDPDRVHFCPTALIEFSSPRPATRSSRPMGLGDGPVLGFVGGLRPWHGTDFARTARVAGHGTATGHDRGRPIAREPGEQPEPARFSDRVVFGRVAARRNSGSAAIADVALAPIPALDHSFYFRR